MDDEGLSGHVIGGYEGQTVLHPVGLAAVIVLGLAMLLVPRRYAMWPMIIMACFIAPAQRVSVFSLNFTLLRIMVLFGTARVLIRREMGGFRWNYLDTSLVAYAISATTIYILQYQNGDALKYKLGVMYDVFGLYFLVRCLIRSWEDIEVAAKGCVVVSVPVLAAFYVEHRTARNLFAFLGGVPAVTIIREGRVRCQGAFAHPIMAGCFWAALVPMIGALYWTGRKGKIWAVVGLATSTTIVSLTASSTPMAAEIIAVIGALAFFVRYRMRAVRWGIVIVLIALHFARDKPVWHLLARIDLSGGSTGYHRYALIDGAIHHFGEWWLLGTRDTEHWGEGLSDLTDQYVLEGVWGGLLTLILFINLITQGFRAAGRIWRIRNLTRAQLAMAWALGVCLFVHTTNFFGVSYFGQMPLIWYLHLGAIGSMLPVTSAANRSISRNAPKRRKPTGPPEIRAQGLGDGAGQRGPATAAVQNGPG
jgi:hypothetical protein